MACLISSTRLPVRTDGASGAAGEDAAGLDPALFPARQALKEIIVRFSASAPPDERGMWRRAAEAFQAEFPLVRVDMRFDLSPGLSENLLPSAQVLMVSPVQLGRLRSRLVRLDRVDPVPGWAGGEGLVDGALEIGRTDGSLYGLPVLRSTSLVCVDREVFARCKLPPGGLRTPLDIYRAGHAIEAALGAKYYGAKHLGLFHYAALNGIEFACDGREVRFDGAGLERVLEAVRPYIREHHFTLNGPPTLQDLLAGRCGIFQTFTSVLPYLGRAVGRIAPVRIPLAPGGFVSAGAWVAVVVKSSAAADVGNSLLFLGFLASRKGQEILCEHSPHWLSVRADVLESQRARSPFPDGAVVYDLDPRGFGTQRDPRLFFAYGDHLNREAEKFFKGEQNLRKTLENLRRPPAWR